MLAGRYGLEHALSQGGDTVVYGGYDSVLMRAVAVKIFYGAGAAVEVLGEARTAAGLNHPNIAQIYDYGEFGDGRRTPYLVMEFLDGETLADRLARTGAFRWREAAEICADISAAVAAAHAQNLVHGDVSARRVMLTPDGVKVLGFETATAGDPDGTGIAADMAALDLLFTECLMGSPGMRDVARLPRALHDFHQAGTAASVTEVLRRATGPTPLPRTRRPASKGRSRRRAAVMGSVAVVTAVVSIIGLQLANGTTTPGGQSAEAAVEAPQPARTTTPHISSLAPSDPAVTPARKRTAPTTGTVRKKVRTTTPTTPKVTPTAKPTKTPGKPTTSPTTSPTPEQTEPTTEPTTPETTEPTPEDTPTDTPTSEGPTATTPVV
ncbi:protein kinase domain-containing protein [Paractinoplanes durhamensis]|nr:protein kinase [Actinoplanes durhamensis]